MNGEDEEILIALPSESCIERLRSRVVLRRLQLDARCAASSCFFNGVDHEGAGNTSATCWSVDVKIIEYEAWACADGVKQRVQLGEPDKAVPICLGHQYKRIAF